MGSSDPNKFFVGDSLSSQIFLDQVTLTFNVDGSHALTNKEPFARGGMRFLQKNNSSECFFMLETFRYVLFHVKYKISPTNSTGKVIVFEIQHILMHFTSDMD